jgi:MoaA/NifB/PqqE/SkfB family radical SAM enzyme
MKTGMHFQTVELSLNNFCTLNCEGCPSLSLNSSGRNELDFTNVFAKLKMFEIKKFVLCGNSGEPLLHSKIDSILNDLFEQFPKTEIHISTNGENLFENVSEKTLLKITPHVLFQVAIDGPNQNIHEITRVGGNLKRVLETLKSLKNLKVPFEVVYSRHLENESFAEKTANLIKETCNEELFFRDTTIITKTIKPPKSISKNGNVSVLYPELKNENLPLYTPNTKYLYIDHTGDCYPCVSFVKYKTTLIAPNINSAETWIEFAKKFYEFQRSFCSTFQSEGDKRQCALNCGVYNSFKYDNLNSLRML